MPERDAAYYQECLRLCESCLELAELERERILERYDKAQVYADMMLSHIAYNSDLICWLHERREHYLEVLHGVAA